MADRIAIMGPGAVGSYVGAFLVQAGEDDITFIDMWPEHVEKMRAEGLRSQREPRRFHRAGQRHAPDRRPEHHRAV